MTSLHFGWRNAGRAPLRSLLTVLAVAMTLLAFLLLRALSSSWTEQVAQTPNNRVVSRHKVGWSQYLPVHYAEEIRRLPGVTRAMGGTWVSAKYPRNDKLHFDVTAVEAKPFAAMHYELEAPAEQRQRWVESRQGAMVSAELMTELGLRLGDTIHLESTLSSASWDLEVACVFQSVRHGFAHRDVWMHWEYYNERLPEADRDKINIVSAEIGDPAQGANIARSVDIHFDARDNQTYTQEDQALNASFVGMFSAILEAIDVVSVLVLGILLLLIGNTMAMNVRERVHEYGVLRAIGFTPARLATFVMGEATCLGLAGGAFAWALSYPVIEQGVSRWVQEEMRMPPLEVSLSAALFALTLGALLGVASAALPARTVARLDVVDALRRID